MFIHHVFFWLKNPENQTDKDAMFAGLESLRSIPTLRIFHLGVPAETSRPVIDRSYSFSLLTVFDDPADEAIYQVHPIHVAFVERCKHLWERVVVYDSVNANPSVFPTA